MPTYVYETIPRSESEPPKRFEIRQSMKDDALTHHPDSGQPVRRVPIGGTGMMGGGSAGSASSGGGSASGGSCGTGCGCH
jgi:predicted nucleic acid-binding Zn ribbon protein